MNRTGLIIPVGDRRAQHVPEGNMITLENIKYIELSREECKAIIRHMEDIVRYINGEIS